ncbi:MAG: M3 family metallopeptidase [Pirellulaceae bacterium]|nr:M3 family metallopeptidase [Pirellulaceae bacterium]
MFKTSQRRPNRLSSSLLTMALAASVTHGNCDTTTAATIALNHNSTTTNMQDDNPLMKPSTLPFEAPDFSAIKNEHFLPAFYAGMAEQKQEIEAIANDANPPTFENTLEAMERSGVNLRRVQQVFFNLSSAHSNPEIQKIQVELAPKMAAHSDDIYLNNNLFRRIQQLHEQINSLNLDAEQQQLLRETYKSFVRAGAMLNADQQQRIRQINERSSSLSTEFQNNLLAITQERAVIVDDVAELDGLSESEIAAAAKAASERDADGKYLLNITNTTRQPVLAQLKNRGLRQRIWEASAYRGLGRDGGIDNRSLVLELAKLRAERAELLGYDSHAAYALEPQMAKNPAAAIGMLSNLVPDVVAKAQREAADIHAKMRADGIEDEVRPWDWEYYAEKVRQERYGIDENEVKQYLELDSVLINGVFYTMNRLFGVSFIERHDLPVYHPDVRVFDVIDQDGSQIGLFYADYFARPSKRGGAWMSSFVSQSHLLGKKPVIVNVMNIPKPVEGAPALMSFDHATTMFHEMGHGVHGLFSDVKYPSLAGTSVPRDYVEFPSTFQEDWAIHPEVLNNYARHYQTGEVMPQSLLQQVVAAKTFNQGYDTLEYLSSALLDLRWHALKPGDVPADMEAFEERSLAELGVNLTAVPPRYKTAFFAHVWPGGYAASYYAYMWSEVLAADSFEYVRQNGGLTTENGNRLRRTVLSRGNSLDPEQQYLDFTGSQPSVDGLLIRRGLKTPAVTD